MAESATVGAPTSRLAWWVSFAACAVAANVATSRWGLVPAGFGLLVPAGTYLAGLALSVRDGLHEAGGVRWALTAVAGGAALSFVVADPRIALASTTAFAVAELLDLAVYVPLRRRGARRAVVASNVIGALADTALFLWLSGFGLSWPAVVGQLLVKAVWCTGVYLLIREVRFRFSTSPTPAASGCVTPCALD